VKYFFDNTISYRFAAMLRALQVDAVALREEYHEHTDDIPLFKLLRGRSIVFVTTDTSQLTREHEARGEHGRGGTLRG